MLPTNPIHELEVSRRQVLASTGSLVVGGSALAWLQSGPAAAAVDVRDLDIPQESVSSKDGTAESVTVQTACAYQYEVNQADTLEWRLMLASDEQSDFQAIDTVSESAAANSGSGQITLGGIVTDHPSYNLAIFSPGPRKSSSWAFPCA